MAGDSALVIIGTVVSDSVVTDVDPVTEFTLATIRIGDVVKARSPFVQGSKVVVRQVGSASQITEVPLMKVGRQYLLYLTPSGLPGERATQFYVTGANAGVYAQSGDPSSFKQVQRRDGEDLPVTVTRQGAGG